MTQNTLITGYKQVSKFSEDEDEYERNEDGSIAEEVVYVTLDLGPVEPRLVPSTTEYRLIGLDTPTPYIQLSGSIFKGQHQHLLGTELLFSEEKDDHSTRTTKHFTPFGTSEQRIRFKEVELVSKDGSQTQPSGTTQASKFVVSATPDVFAAISGTAEEVPTSRTSGRRGRPRGRGTSRGGRRGADVEADPKGKRRATEEDEVMEEDISRADDTPMDVEDTNEGPATTPPSALNQQVLQTQDNSNDMDMIDPSLR